MQFFPDVTVVVTVSEVVGGVTSGREEVGVCSFMQQQFDQGEVLLVYSQMQSTTAVMLLLHHRDTAEGFYLHREANVKTTQGLNVGSSTYLLLLLLLTITVMKPTAIL